MINSKILISFLLGLCLLPGFLTADEIKINVESIACSNKRSDLEKPVKCDQKLLDLKHKLAQLPFENFVSTGVQQAKLATDKKQTFKLQNADLLTLELLYLEGSRVGLLIDWEDQSGMQLLDTRMHFDRNETMLAGADTDSEANNGKILAISLEK